MKKRILTLAIALILSIGMITPVDTYAASVGVGASGGTCNVGGTVTVTVRYSSADGTPLFAAKFGVSYDSSALSLVGKGGQITTSNGNDFLIESMDGTSSIYGTLTFKVNKAGSYTVSVSTLSGMDANGIAFSAGSTSAIVKGNAPAPTPSTPSAGSGSSSSGTTSSSGSSSSSSSTKPTKPAAKPNESTNGRGNDEPEEIVEEVEKVEEVDPSQKPETIEVVIGEKTYIIVENLKDKELPKGFEAKKIGYGEYKWEIQVAKSENSKYTLMLLQDKETSEETWWFYNEETGEFTNSTTLDVLETLEFESLKNTPKEEQSNTLLYVFVGLSVVLAGGLGYLVYRFKDELLPKKDN